MAIEYICKGCRHCRIDAPEDIEDGLCPHCLQKRDFPSKEVSVSRTQTWLLAVLGASVAAWLHASASAPAVCFGIVIGSGMALCGHWAMNKKEEPK